MLLDWIIVGGLFAVLFIGLYLYWVYGENGGRDDEE